MRYFIPLHAGGSDKRSLTYSLSTERKTAFPWPEDRWSPTKGLIYMDKTGSSAFNEETRRELPKLTALVNPLVQDMPDIIGEFSSALFASPPLVTDRLHDLIEALAPGFCEYLEGPAIWDTVFEREIDRTAYRFVTVVKQVDTWDHTLSDITRMDRSDGSTWYSLGAAQVVDAKKAEGLHLWRDSVTKHVLVSEEFKRRVEAGGISNFYFREVQTNAAA